MAATAQIAKGAAVTTPEGYTGTVTTDPVLTASGQVVSVAYDAEFAHLSPVGGADYAVEELAPVAAERNPNLDRHMAEVNAKLEAADERGDHVHAAVRVDVCGSTQSGPVRGWSYDPQAPGYGHLELVNYRGEALRKPLTDVALYDVRPCWDRCEGAAAPVARGTVRATLGASSAIGWELLYDKPRQGCEVGRRVVGGEVQYALICKEHGQVYRLARLAQERGLRREGGWCSSC